MKYPESQCADFSDLQINSFMTSDGVMLTYWEAGRGKPPVFMPGWSANGAQWINMYCHMRYLRSDRFSESATTCTSSPHAAFKDAPSAGGRSVHFCPLSQNNLGPVCPGSLDIEPVDWWPDS